MGAATQADNRRDVIAFDDFLSIRTIQFFVCWKKRPMKSLPALERERYVVCP